MAFGRLCTKWQLFRWKMPYKISKCAKVIRVCTKLHNFCIRMAQRDGEGWIGRIEGKYCPLHYGIDPWEGQGERGYVETHLLDYPEVVPSQEYNTLAPSGQRRDGMMTDVVSRGLRRPPRNIARNS